MSQLGMSNKGCIDYIVAIMGLYFEALCKFGSIQRMRCILGKLVLHNKNATT